MKKNIQMSALIMACVFSFSGCQNDNNEKEIVVSGGG